MATTGTGLARGAIGLVVLAYLHMRHRERLPEMKKVFADGLSAVDQPVTSGGAA